MHPRIGAGLLLLRSASNSKAAVEILYDFSSAKTGNEFLPFTNFNPIVHSWQAFYGEGFGQKLSYPRDSFRCPQKVDAYCCYTLIKLLLDPVVILCPRFSASRQRHTSLLCDTPVRSVCAWPHPGS